MYMLTIGDLTDEERDDLYKWVESGNSAYDNPHYYSDERGNPMDYISTMRVIEEQVAEMESAQTIPKRAHENDDVDEIEPPF
jgi:hypothetical protein